MRQKQIANLKKKARQLGLAVVDQARASGPEQKGELPAQQEQKAEARQGQQAAAGAGKTGRKATSKKGGRAKAAKQS